MLTSLVRIPCLLVAMVGLHTATTPPHPPPGSEEKAPSTSMEVILKQRAGPYTVKTIVWAAGLVEAAVILASQFPEHEVSETVLSTMVFSGNPVNIRPTKLFFIGAFMAAFGGYIRWSCYTALGRLFTFEMAIRKDHQLVTDGPYSVVRHPGYTGVLFAVTGIVCWHASQGSYARECGAFNTAIGAVAAGIYLALVSTITIGLLSRMSKEDQALRKEFGGQWDQWAKRTPYQLIPFVI